MVTLSNSKYQNRKERANRSTNNRDMSESAIRYVDREGVSYREAELLKILTFFLFILVI